VDALREMPISSSDHSPRKTLADKSCIASKSSKAHRVRSSAILTHLRNCTQHHVHSMQRSGTAPTTCQGRLYKSRPSHILDYEITFKNVRTKNAHSDRVDSILVFEHVTNITKMKMGPRPTKTRPSSIALKARARTRIALNAELTKLLSERRVYRRAA